MKKKTYIQVLGVFACLAVVALHVNGCFWAFSYDRYWITANMIEGICYFAVPVFFMISGATLLNYRNRYSTAVFFKKRFVKTVIPFLAWSVIGLLWQIFATGIVPENFGALIGGIVNTSYVSIYWFFPALFAVYLAVPFLTLIPEKVRKRGFGYAILAAFIFQSLLPLIFSLFNITYNTTLNMPVMGENLIFTLLGYWISNYEIEKKWRYGIYGLGVAGLLMHICFTQVLSYQAGGIVQTFKGYLNVPSVLYATAVFLLFKNLEHKKIMAFLEKITRPFAGLTFGIYLIHWYLIQIAVVYMKVPDTSIVYRVFGTICIFLISALIAKGLQKIPGVKKIIPS